MASRGKCSDHSNISGGSNGKRAAGGGKTAWTATIALLITTISLIIVMDREQHHYKLIFHRPTLLTAPPPPLHRPPPPPSPPPPPTPQNNKQFAENSSAKDNLVYPTFIRNDEAVCLTGNRAAYYLIPGYDDGIDNWLIYLPGGGWCRNMEACLAYVLKLGINQPSPPINLGDIHVLSNLKDKNPNFFNWNKVLLRYCDASSFTGDSERTENGTKLYFKGAIIFKSAMEELLEKGMRFAKNALLVGDSAGGLASLLHCDRFRYLFSNNTRVKCISDAAYFFPPKRYNKGRIFLGMFKGLINLHGSSKMLPESCTSKMNPALCFFPPNVEPHIKTPIFFMMSTFDEVEIRLTTSQPSLQICAVMKNCSSSQMKVMQELRLEFLNLLPKQDNSSSRGFVITSHFIHSHILYPWTNLRPIGAKETIAELFADWYFDRKVVQIIDNYPCPYRCN